jgi:hypothetical protein
MKIIFVYLLLINLTALNLFSQDLIILKNTNDTIKCKIIEDKIIILKYKLYNSKDTSIYQIGIDKVDNYIVLQNNNNVFSESSFLPKNSKVIDSLLNINLKEKNRNRINSIFIELGGGNFGFSLNYERKIIEEKSLALRLN